MRLILIGYWKGPRDPRWPDPQAFVDPSWDAEEREDVADYLRYGMVSGAFMGLSECRFCGKRNGSLELTDGVYVWPQGLAHYLIEHGVRLPRVFVEHVYRLRDATEEAQVDGDWWLAQHAWSQGDE